MRIITSLILLLTLVSCTTIDYNRVSKYQNDIDSKYPPISLIINNGHIFSSVSVIGSTANIYRDKTSSIIYKEFKRSRNFSKLSYNKVTSPFVVEINTQKIVHDRDNYFWKLLLTISTLGLVPTETNYTFNAEVNIRRANQIIKSYNYSVDVTKKTAIYYSTQGYKKNAFKILMSRFFKDIEAMNPFAT